MSIYTALSSILLCAVGATIAHLIHRLKIGSYERYFKDHLDKHERQLSEKKHAFELLQQKEEFEQRQKLETLKNKAEANYKEQKEHYKKKELELLEQSKTIKERFNQLKKQEELVFDNQSKVNSLSQELEEKKQLLINKLEMASNLSQEEAEEKLFEQVRLETQKKAAIWRERFLKERRQNVDTEATKLVASAFNRIALSAHSELCLSSISLPSEEMKARIIGREGRNIQFLENILGVNLLVDETPKTVLVSAIDPERKAIAVETLKQLIQDGRIHPTKIEQEYQKATQEIKAQTQKKVEDYAFSLGICNLSPHLMTLLAKMDLMYSYNQNLLDHSYHVALIMGVVASELGLDSQLAKRIGFLHDIGKAANATLGQTHAMIGMKLAKKGKESEDVCNGIGAHHHEIPAKTLEASLCGMADALSAARPGARVESLHSYIKRIQKLETLALSFKGVLKAYVLQAGREIRVMTCSSSIREDQLPLLAKQIADKIAEKTNLSGQIKISVLREKEVVEFAQF